MNRYKISLVLFFLAFSAQYAHAGWSDWFNNQALVGYKNQAITRMKDPKTYIIGAAVAAGTYFIGRELYWRLSDELPYTRAQSYVRQKIASSILDTGDRDAIFEEIDANLKATVQRRPGDCNAPIAERFKKQELNVLVDCYRKQYEFYAERQLPFRNAQSTVDGIDICDRSNLVKNQNGATCAMHSAFNGIELYRFMNHQQNENIFDLLKCGPPIDDWKNRLSNFENLLQGSDYNTEHENLSDKALRRLMGEVYNDILTDTYTIIPNTREYGPEIDEWLHSIAQCLQEKEGAMHIFILGSMRSYENQEGQMCGSMGHWIAVLARRFNGHIILYVMDTWREKNTEPRLVEHLAGLLHTPHNELKLIHTIHDKVETARHVAFNSGDPNALKRALNRVEHVLNIVLDEELLQSDTFTTRYQDTIADILDHIALVLESDKQVQDRIATYKSILQQADQAHPTAGSSSAASSDAASSSLNG